MGNNGPNQEFIVKRNPSRPGRALRWWRSAAVAATVALGAASCSSTAAPSSARRSPPPTFTEPATPTPTPTPSPTGGPTTPAGAPKVVPAPASLTATGATFTLSAGSRIRTPAGSAEAAQVGNYLATLLRRSTGYPLPVRSDGRPAGHGDIVLVFTAPGRLGAEGYQLTATDDEVTIRAATPAGLFHGVQTLRQLLPARVDSPRVRPGPWVVPGVVITDQPRFAWRGAALDVVRHFYTVAEVERYIDLLALYKINTLHLHLSDDQGWRIAVTGWPKLTSVGGRTEVGGGAAGFYTQDEYRQIVRYAQQRYVTVVPEIDMPGHVNAALVAYPELSCDGTPRAPYTRIGGPLESLCVGKPVVHQFLEAVIGQLAALTPGRYLHVGGDEVRAMGAADYAAFTTMVEKIARAHGKTPVGWQEVAAAGPVPGTVVQYWNTNTPPDAVRAAAAAGHPVVLSPAAHVYLDMQYHAGMRRGLHWAGYVTVHDAYDWDPATLLSGVAEHSVLGVEAELFSETLPTFDDVEFMAFPRLAAVAEVGWSPQSARDWDSFRQRLAAQGPRWTELSVDFYRAPQIPWPG